MSAVAADHPPSFTNRVEMMDRIKALGEENERVKSENGGVVAEKDTAVMERDRSIAELREIQSNIDRLCQSHSIEVEALQIENADIKAENEHLHAIINTNETKFKLEQKATLQRCEKQLEIIKKEKQFLEDEHHTVKQAME